MPLILHQIESQKSSGGCRYMKDLTIQLIRNFNAGKETTFLTFSLSRPEWRPSNRTQHRRHHRTAMVSYIIKGKKLILSPKNQALSHAKKSRRRNMQHDDSSRRRQYPYLRRATHSTEVAAIACIVRPVTLSGA